MRKKNFKAGYISDGVTHVINEFRNSLDLSKETDKKKLNKINGLLEYVSSFNVEFPTDHNPNYKNIHPVLAVVNNIITRGLPTRVPIEVEEQLVTLGINTPSTKQYEYLYDKTQIDIDYDEVFKLLHIIDPGLQINREDYAGELGNKSEWVFLNNTLAKYPFAKQILEGQRDFSTINPKVEGGRTVDFSYSSPYHREQTIGGDKKVVNDNRGFIIEVDGKHHQQYEYQLYDNYRNDAAEEVAFETYRWSNITESVTAYELDNLFTSGSNKIYAENYKRTLDDTQLLSYYGLFLPLAIARVQKTMVEALLVNSHLLEKDKIILAIVERDIPCGKLGVEIFEKLVLNLNALLSDEQQYNLPEIEVVLFGDERWHSKSYIDLQVDYSNDESYFQSAEFDLVLDISILRRSGIYKEKNYVPSNGQSIVIRSSHYTDKALESRRRVYCADLLKYEALVGKNDDGSYFTKTELSNHLNYILTFIFRKKAFRDGQLPIISRALRGQPVIGLLPTGGGKSLTYQFSAFLQPGLSIVVDPIKSLMEDQVRVLNNNWIDSCLYINSNQSREQKRNNLIDFRYGEALFFFISPERYVMEDFRQILHAVPRSPYGLSFSYGVIDEVHCVSEWGHDFRTTYLMLGNNLQTFTRTKNDKPVTLIGLTATASFDVLADIERELKIENNDLSDALIAIDNTIRPELFFSLVPVDVTSRIETLNSKVLSIKRDIEYFNTDDILRQSVAHHFVEFENQNVAKKINNVFGYSVTDNETVAKLVDKIKLTEALPEDHNYISFITFCATKSDTKGVPFVYEQLKSESIGYYYATDNQTRQLEVNQHFVDFTSGKTNHMVCTKAFGMGIDKEDIRGTFHYNYASSLESTIQECGRAGRDGRVALAQILLQTEVYYVVNILKIFGEYSDHNIIKNKHWRRTLREKFYQYWDNETNTFQKVEFKSEEEAEVAINSLDINGMSSDFLLELKSILLFKKLNSYTYLDKKTPDREVLDYFYSISYKGLSTERSQILNLMQIKEFGNPAADDLFEQQDTLKVELAKKSRDFRFILSTSKVYKNNSKKICELLKCDPAAMRTQFKTNEDVVLTCLKYHYDFNDFLFQLEERGVIFKLELLETQVIKRIEFVYGRDRSAIDTGRLVYRMHSMGLLTDYTIDYNLNLYHCKMYLSDSIRHHLEKIKDYLSRYLSETSVDKEMTKLEKRIYDKESISDQVHECLLYLSEFSYEEIASKKKRATTEIEGLFTDALANYGDNKYKQNTFLKEEIYFYFNAKYARIGFQIEGKDYSLPADRTSGMKGDEILSKYLKVIGDKGTAQNNYKHMIGSCKKIIRTLADTDLRNEWLLYLLKSFSLFAINVPSYLEEADKDIRIGFQRLYDDIDYHRNDFKLVNDIVTVYFDVLKTQLDKENSTISRIETHQLNVVLEIQAREIEQLTTKNKSII
tara:strand:+ start:1576 stop:5880 length:4305 start_codon:yes stop_codon:yes gene_type:complete